MSDPQQPDAPERVAINHYDFIEEQTRCPRVYRDGVLPTSNCKTVDYTSNDAIRRCIEVFYREGDADYLVYELRELIEGNTDDE